MPAIDLNEIPDQTRLIEQLNQSNRLASHWHWFLLVASAPLAYAIDWFWVAKEPFLSLVALLLVPSQYLPGLARTLLKKKKRIEELSETFQAGVFTKQKLLSLIRETSQSLGIDIRHVPVYLTRDKDLNAFAVNVGLSRLLPSVRGIYINRQTLHVSSVQGLKSTIGHELGHLFPYELKWHGGWLVKLTFGGLLAVFVLQKTGAPSAWGLMIATAAAWAFLFLDGLPQSKMSQPIEYLCDGFGAKASGVTAAIYDLLNFGNESQAQYELSIAALKLASQGKAINDFDAMKIYEDVLGYGPTDVDGTMLRIRQAIEKEKKPSNELSIKGLLDFMWRDNVADSNLAQARDAAIAQHEVLTLLPQIDWKEIIHWDPEGEPSESKIESLIEALIANPTHLLFLLPTEPLGNRDLSHPSFRTRILYLWKNRKAIEGSSRFA